MKRITECEEGPPVKDDTEWLVIFNKTNEKKLYCWIKGKTAFNVLQKFQTIVQEATWENTSMAPSPSEVKYDGD